VFVEGLREQWRVLWRTRFDDKIRAEGVARKAYPDLFVDRGLVIIATRDFKPLSFQEILERYFPSQVADIVGGGPRGGVRKFIREYIRQLAAGRKNDRKTPPKPKLARLQLKKGGRGWLHA